MSTRLFLLGAHGVARLEARRTRSRPATGYFLLDARGGAFEGVDVLNAWFPSALGAAPDGSPCGWHVCVAPEDPIVAAPGTSWHLAALVAIGLAHRGAGRAGPEEVWAASGSFDPGSGRFVGVAEWPRKLAALVQRTGAAPDRLYCAAPDVEAVARLAPTARVIGIGAPADLVDALGLASPDPVALAMTRAEAVAREHRSGFVGVEHLLIAAAHGPLGGGPVGDRVAAAARRVATSLIAGLSAYDGPAERAVVTPALRAVLAKRPLDLDGLWAGLAASGDSTLDELLGAPVLAPVDAITTLKSFVIDLPEFPPAALVVMGGPEDGRRVVLSAGETLGRAAPEGGPEHALYASGPSDPRLSRRHLVWLGGGRVSLVRPGRLVRERHPVLCGPGVVEVSVGDVLELTPATRVRVESAPGR